ncbi:MAG: hypothetical protein ACYCSQ_02370 [bacterium]
MRILTVKYVGLCLLICIIFNTASYVYAYKKKVQKKAPVKFINYMFTGRVNSLVKKIDNSVNITYSFYNLSYGEYNQCIYFKPCPGGSSSKYLDTEDGPMPDFGIDFSFTYLHFSNKIHYDYANGNTSYTEQNPPVGTDSDIIYNISDRLGYMLTVTDNFVITPYVKISKYIWNRVILPSYPAVSCRENYQTYYWQAGLIGEYAATPNFLLKISGGIGYTFSPHMTAYLSNPPLHFSLESKMVYSFKIDNYYLFWKHMYIKYGIAYRRLEFGYSQLNSGFVYEPSSVTNTFLYTAGIGYSFK